METKIITSYNENKNENQKSKRSLITHLDQ